jgi:hypothetical protein
MSVDLFDLIIFALGVAIGWGISYYFYKRERKDDTEESRTSEQRHTQMMEVTAEEYEKAEHRASLMLRAMENAGIVKFTRNKLGEFIGLEHQGQLHVYAEGKLEAKGTIIKGDDD